MLEPANKKATFEAVLNQHNSDEQSDFIIPYHSLPKQQIFRIQ